VRSVSSVSVESCVSDIVAELPPSFTVPLDQVCLLRPCHPNCRPDRSLDPTVLASAIRSLCLSAHEGLPEPWCIRKPARCVVELL